MPSSGSSGTQGQLTTSAAPIFSTSGLISTITKIVFCNESASPVTISYGVVIKASGLAAGAAGTAQGRSWTLDAAGGSRHTLEAMELAGVTLGVADFAWAQASAPAAVSFLVFAELP